MKQFYLENNNSKMIVSLAKSEALVRGIFKDFLTESAKAQDIFKKEILI